MENHEEAARECHFAEHRFRMVEPLQFDREDGAVLYRCSKCPKEKWIVWPRLALEDLIQKQG